MCSCGAGTEITDHYLLRCQNFALVRSSFLNRIFEINVEFRNMNDSTLTSLLLFDSEEQTFDVNTNILNLTIKFLKDIGSFDEPLLWLKLAIWVLKDISQFFVFIIIWFLSFFLFLLLLTNSKKRDTSLF